MVTGTGWRRSPGLMLDHILKRSSEKRTRQRRSWYKRDPALFIDTLASGYSGNSGTNLSELRLGHVDTLVLWKVGCVCLLRGIARILYSCYAFVGVRRLRYLADMHGRMSEGWVSVSEVPSAHLVREGRLPGATQHGLDAPAAGLRSLRRLQRHADEQEKVEYAPNTNCSTNGCKETKVGG